jgi:hypothetical protein
VYTAPASIYREPIIRWSVGVREKKGRKNSSLVAKLSTTACTLFTTAAGCILRIIS